MAESFKILSSFMKDKYPDLADGDDREVAEFALSKFPNEFKREEFDFDEKGFFEKVGEKVSEVGKIAFGRGEKPPEPAGPIQREFPEPDLEVKPEIAPAQTTEVAVEVPEKKPEVPEPIMPEVEGAPPASLAVPIVEPKEEVTPELREAPPEEPGVIASTFQDAKRGVSLVRSGIQKNIVAPIARAIATGAGFHEIMLKNELHKFNRAAREIEGIREEKRTTTQKAIIKNRDRIAEEIERNIVDTDEFKDHVKGFSDFARESVPVEDQEIVDGASEYLLEGSVADRLKRYVANPLKTSKALAVMGADQGPRTLQAIIPGAGWGLMIAEEAGNFSTTADNLSSQSGVKFDDDIVGQWALKFGVPSGMIETMTDKLVLGVAKGAGISGALSKITSGATSKLFAGVLVRAGMEASEEMLQAGAENMTSWFMMKDQIDRFNEQGKTEEAKKLTDYMQNVIAKEDKLSDAAKQAWMGGLLGGLFGAPAAVKAAAAPKVEPEVAPEVKPEAEPVPEPAAEPAVEPKPEIAEPLEKRTEAIKAKHAAKEKLPSEIINPIADTDEKIAKATDPELIKSLEKNKRLEQDAVIPKVVKKQSIEEAVKKLDDANIPYSYVAMDGVNMKGANEAFEHTGTNERMKAVWGDILQKNVEEYGGLIARDQGDELYAVFPNYTVDETNEIMANIREQIKAKLPELGLDKLTHARLGLPNMETLDISYGVSEGRPGKYGDVDREADQIANVQKEAEIIDKAKTENHIWNEELKRYVPTKIPEERRVAERRKPREGAPAPIEERRKPERPERRKPKIEPKKPAEVAEFDVLQVAPTGKETPPKIKKRKRGLGSVVGAAGGIKQTKLEKTQNEKASSAQSKFEKQDKIVQAKLGPKVRLGKARDWLATRLIQLEAPIVKALEKNPLGQRAIMHFQLARGASAKAKMLYNDIEKKVFESVPREQEDVFRNLLQAFRNLEVEDIAQKRQKKALAPLILQATEKDLKPGQRLEAKVEKIEGKTQVASAMGMTVEESQSYIDEAKKQLGDDWKGVQQALDEYWGVMNEQVNELKKEGLIDEGLHKYLTENHKHYHPRWFIQHIDPDVESFDGQGNKITVTDSGLKRLGTGSEEALLNDPRLFLQNVVSRTQSRIFKNRANKSLYEFVKENPDNDLGLKIEKPSGENKFGMPTYSEAPRGMTRISAMIDGKRMSVLMPDKIANHWTLYDPQISNEMTTMFRALSGTPLLKAFATGVNPEFAVGNFFRDIAFTWFKQKDAYHAVLPVAWAQMAKDFIKVAPDVLKGKGRVKDYISEGGGMDFLAAQGFIMRSKFGEASSTTAEALQQVQEALGWLGNTTEMWTRIALRERLMSKGMSSEEATHAARTNLDFAQGGSATKAVDNFVPYLNASIQGTRGVFQAFKADPKLATFKALQIVAFAASMAYWNKKRDKEAWDEISEREKINRWIITLPISFMDSKTGKKRHVYIGVPKDQGQRIFAAIGETIAGVATGEKVNADKVLMAIHEFMPISTKSFLPPTVEALMTYTSNKDFWRNQDVWKGRRVDPEFEQYPDTPKIWNMLGEKLEMSPVRMQAAMNKVFPKNIYTDLLGFSWDQLLSGMDSKDRDDINKELYEKMISVPGWRKVVRATWPYRTDDIGMKKDMKKYRVSAYGADGEIRTRKQLNEEIRKAKRKQNNERTRNDVELTRYVLQKEHPKIEVPSFGDFVRELTKDPREIRRLKDRYKKELVAIKRRKKK